MWIQSGHYDNFKDNMYFTSVDEREFAVKPMNCPGSTLVYRTKLRSYRDLPVKLAEFGKVHRNELAGVLHGLLRVRSFTQDDAHVFCMPEQIEREVTDLIDFTKEVYAVFGFNEIETYIATRPEKSMGTDEIWEQATSGLKNALDKRGMKFGIKEGEGAFYGPKIEFNIRDAIGRKWQCGTIQIDFSMPARFGLEYVGADNARHTPVMIHRAIFGSIERFIAILIENYAGRFPLWLAPVQTVVLPISEGQHEYAQKVYDKLVDSGIRAQIDLRNEKIGYKIREWEMKKLPFIFVVGAKEAESGLVALRKHGETNNDVRPLDEAIQLLLAESKIPL
jgi:threonyl-tRNA synthetase